MARGNKFMAGYKANDPFRKKNIVPGGGGYRSPGGTDPQMQGTQGDLPGGQQQLGPWHQSAYEGYLEQQ